MRNRGQIQRREARQASHGDDWLITYADTITLLLCLFVVLLAMEGHKRQTPPTPALSPPMTQAMAPIRFWDGTPPFPHMARSADPDDDGGAVDPAADAAPDMTDGPALAATTDGPPPIVLAPASPVSGRIGLATSRYWTVNDPPVSVAATALPMAAPSDPEAAAMPPPDGSEVPAASLSDIAAQASPPGTARMAQSGDRITILEFASTAFFGSGSATLTGSGKAILTAMVGQLNAREYQGYRVTVEGHTDDAPINTVQFPSNWELSTARATAVVRFLVDQGIGSQRLRAAGYADTRPLSPNRNQAGVALPDNQARNRRVAIVLEKIERNGIDVAAR